MSLRPLFAILIAAAMLFAPLAMKSGSAMAMAPADHQSSMTKAGHCGEQPADGNPDKRVDKPCCIAMCTAIAMAAGPMIEPHAFARSVQGPSPAEFRHSFLAKLPTPPPRRA